MTDIQTAFDDYIAIESVLQDTIDSGASEDEVQAAREAADSAFQHYQTLVENSQD